MLLRRIVAVVIAALALAAVGLALLWSQVSAAPTWYAPIDPEAGGVAELAERVEYGLVETFRRIRPSDEPWVVRIEEAQMNAWLAARLPEWVAHDESLSWPEEVSVPQVHVGPAGIDVAVGVRQGDREQVVVTRLEPRVEDGHLHVDVDRVALGRLELPGSAGAKVLELVDRFAPGGAIDDRLTARLLGILSPDLGGSARIDLSDGRRVELLEVRLVEGGIDLTSRTVQGE